MNTPPGWDFKFMNTPPGWDLEFMNTPPGWDFKFMNTLHPYLAFHFTHKQLHFYLVNISFQKRTLNLPNLLVKLRL